MRPSLRYITLILFISFFACSCKKTQNQIRSEKTTGTDLQLSKDTVYTNKVKQFDVVVNFTNIKQLKKLVISKKANDTLTVLKMVDRANIASAYTFNYTITDQDAEQFSLVFKAVGLDSTMVFSKSVVVKNHAEIIPYNLIRVARVTGKSLAGETFPNPNKTDENYDVGGTDLGIMWGMGNGKIGIVFGDTFGSDWKVTPGGGGYGSNWRSNVLGFSDDQNLDDGLTLSGMAMSSDGLAARQIISSVHNTTGNGSFTAIPTAAIRANGVDYIHFMDIRQWGAAGQWATNYSGLSRSSDNGSTWDKPTEIRFSATSNFAQAAYYLKDGYVYMLGTPSGRFGDAYLARFAEADILKQTAYQYWNKDNGWVTNNESAATSIFDGPVGEASLAYNTHFKRWIATYLDENKHQVVLRDAINVTGPWNASKKLVSANDYPALYGAFIHPYKNDGEDLYFTMSMWFPYNVFLMKAKLKLGEL